VTFSSQWSAAATVAAITGLGKRIEEEGGIGSHSPVPGCHHRNDDTSCAPDIIAGIGGRSQLKGPEIAAWSKIERTVDSTGGFAARRSKAHPRRTGFGLHKPQGHWHRPERCRVFATQHVFSVRPGDRPRSARPRRGDMGRVQTSWPRRWKPLAIIPVANGGSRGTTA